MTQLEIILIFVCLILFFLCIGFLSMWRGAERRADYYLEIARTQNRVITWNLPGHRTDREPTDERR